MSHIRLSLLLLTVIFLVGESSWAQSTAAALKSAYVASQSAENEADYTKIIALIDGADLASAKPAVQQYGEQLLAWALNRRGEQRWDRAASVETADGKKALADFERSLELDSRRWRAKQNLAFVRASQGKLADAETLLDEVIEAKPDHANAYFNRGELRYELGKMQEAVVDYTRAIAMSPSEADFYTSRAHALYSAGNTSASIDDYRKAYELDSANPSRAIDHADALQMVGRWQEAANQYRIAASLAPDSVRAKLNLAWLLATCPDENIRDANQALSITQKLEEVPADEQFRYIDTYAASLAATSKFDEALQVARTGVGIAPGLEQKAFGERIKLYEARQSYQQAAGIQR